MWRIIEFFGRYGNILLFLFLEILSLLTIISFNEKQNFAFQKFSHEISGKFSGWNHRVSSYFFLGEQNLKLQEENARLNEESVLLRQKVANYQYRFPYSRDFIFSSDSLLALNYFDFIPARVINNSLNQNYNYLTLDKGEIHGIKKNMGIISPTGIAGMVISVSKNFSIALSVLNKNFRLSARVTSNRNVGSLSWDGSSPDFGHLDFIPQTSPLEVGDTVLTSGYSSVFPEDYMVGTVSRVDETNHTGFYNIEVKFSTNFHSLDQVYFVKSQDRSELDSLEAGRAR